MISRRTIMNDRIVFKEGRSLSLINVKGSKIKGLSIYGKSTQQMTESNPSPEQPQEIEVPGDGGKIKLMLSDGNEKEQLLTLSTPNGLPGIPVDTGGNYTDGEGQQWVCDEIDLEKGKYIQRVAVESKTGGWALKETSDSLGRYAQFELFESNFLNGSNKSICNIAQWVSWAGDSRVDGWSFALSYTGVYIRPPKGTTEEQLDEQLNGLDTPVVFLGQLAEPVERDLTPEEITTYRDLHTNTPSTVITNNADVWMRVGYREWRR